MAHPLAPSDLAHILTHTDPLWKELKGARIFITGGTGFFGCWLLESLFAANRKYALGLEAIVLTRSPSAFSEKMPHLMCEPLVLHSGDVRDFNFPAGKFTHILHAGTTSSAPVPPAEMLDTIFQGTKHTLDFAVQSGATSFLFISSGAVYGRQPEDMDRVPENYAGAPDTKEPGSAYGEGKRAAELLCTIAREEKGIATRIARCFAFVGPHLPLDAHFAIGNFIRDALEGGSIQIKGDGTSVRSYLYAADLCVFLWKLLLQGAPGSCINIGSGEAFSMKELAGIVADTLSPTSRVEISGLPLAGPIHRYVPDCSLARELFGDHMKISLPDGILRTAQWIKESRPGSIS